MKLHAYYTLIGLAFFSASLGFIDDTRDVKWNTLSGKKTQLVGHRGEKSFLPEHSVGSYWQAALEGADYIEPDLALTKDGHIVVIHNEWLSATTNVKHIPELAQYRTTRTWINDGRSKTIKDDWFIVDLTLEQIKSIRLVQEDLKFRPQIYNEYFEIPTFEEYLQLIRNLTVNLGRPFGVIPELKSPKFYNSNRTYDRFFEDRAILTLEHYGWANVTSNIDSRKQPDLKLQDVEPLPKGVKLGPSVLQSFDQNTAAYLAENTNVPVVALNEYNAEFFTPKGLDEVAKYAKIVSPWKDFFVTGVEANLASRGVTWDPAKIDKMGGFIAPEKLAHEIHSRGMEVSPYTFYDSHQNLNYLCQKGVKPSSQSGFCPKNKTEEFFYFFDQGIDYMFVEDLVEANILRILYSNRLEKK